MKKIFKIIAQLTLAALSSVSIAQTNPSIVVEAQGAAEVEKAKPQAPKPLVAFKLRQSNISYVYDESAGKLFEVHASCKKTHTVAKNSRGKVEQRFSSDRFSQTMTLDLDSTFAQANINSTLRGSNNIPIDKLSCMSRSCSVDALPECS